VGRPGGGEVPHRGAAGGAAALRAPVRARTARVHRAVARPAGRGDGHPGGPADGRAGPDRRPAQARRRLLHGHAQEGRPGGGAAAQSGSPVPGRAVRGRGPGLGAGHPRGAGALHGLGRHRRLLLARDGAGGEPVRLGRGDGRGPDRGARPAPTLQDAFLSLVGARRSGADGLDWLGGGAR
jgi:hypothetical protein